MKFSSLPYSIRLIACTVLVAGTTTIGMFFYFGESSQMQIWSPAGLSIVILYYNGTRFLPAVFVGVALINLFFVPSVSLALALAIGSVLEGYIGYRLLLYLKFNPALHTLTDAGKLIVISGLIGTLCNALFSASSFSLWHQPAGVSFLDHTLLYWTGNFVGVIAISPVLFIVIGRQFERLAPGKIAELAGLTVVVFILSHSIFHAKIFSYLLNASLAFMLFPFAIVAAIRFGMLGSVMTTSVAALNAILSIQTEVGLFAPASFHSSILLINIFIIVLGTTSLALAALTDERATSERMIRKSEERYRIISERTGQLIYDYNVATGVIHWSGAIEEVTQYTAEEFAKVDVETWTSLIHQGDRDRAVQALSASMESRTEYNIEYRFQRKDGSFIDVYDRGAFLYRNSSDTIAYRMLGTMADITVINRTVKQLKESEERYRLFSTLTSDYIYFAVLTNGRMITEWASDAFQRITGYTVEEVNKPGTWELIIHPEDLNRSREWWEQTQKGEPAVVEYRLFAKSGEVLWLRDYVKPVGERDSHGEIRIMGGVQDITERKRGEERFRMLIEKSADGIVLLDQRGMIIFVSESEIPILGYTPEELLNKSIFDILHPSEKKKYSFKFGRLLMEFERSEYLLGRFRHKNGEWISIEGMVTNLLQNSSVNAFVANFRNVTERIRNEERLRHSLQEKNILLKEVHHRVKNNMQVISSLLNLQSSSLKNAATQAMFRESQNRVKSMALVHEILYQSNDLASVNFPLYVKQLIASLEKSFGSGTGSVAITAKIPAMTLDIDTAIPCGLIVNELVSNSLKYAFPKKNRGEIVVTARKRPPALLQMVISDNGIGFSKRTAGNASLGLKLVHALTEQLKGTITIDSVRGTSVKIEFPIHTPTGS
ncbi:MAG: PAS domain S-box protein [Bacteroidota bacterium]